jgi:hypothetical protein
VLQAGEEVPEQGHGAGIRVRAMSVRSQDPAADQPGQQRYADETEEERATEDDQLTSDSRWPGERIARGVLPVQQGRAP